MNLTSSQRWAIGAVTLAVLIACSPRTPEEPVQPPPQAPSLSPEAAASVAPASTGPVEHAPLPSFAGIWASAESECGEPARTFKLSSETIDTTPGGRSCAVKSVSEEHPTGRSMIYTVMAGCLTEGEASLDKFTLNFGAADTIMQLQLNDRDPVRLVRCP